MGTQSYGVTSTREHLVPTPAAWAQDAFKTGIFIPVVILLAMAVFLDLVLMLIQSRLSRWRSPRTEHGRRATFARRILTTGRAGGPA